MSVAARYADQLKRASEALKGTEVNRPCFQEGLARVNDTGCLEFREGALDPARAVEYATWILETFE